MKLIKLSKHLDFATEVIIWDRVGFTGNEKEDWEIVYQGCAADIPICYAKRNLISREDNSGEEAISAYVNERGEAGIRITLEPEPEDF